MARHIEMLCSVFLLALSASPTPPALEGWQGGYVPNLGQWNSQAKFRLETPGLNVWITSDGAVYDRYTLVESAPIQTPNVTSSPSLTPPPGISGEVVRARFVGAAATRFERGPEVGPRLSYFLGADSKKWVSAIHASSEIVQKDLYPGIDARWYVDRGSPRYDLVVAPGADVSRVAIRYEGIENLTVQPNKVVYSTRFGKVEERDLVAYQDFGGERLAVPARFTRRSDGTVGLALAAYDRTKPLVVDPLVYGTGFTANGTFVYSTCADGMTTAVAGNTLSSDFPVNLGSYDYSLAPRDQFVALFEGNELVATTFLGGSDIEGTSPLGLPGCRIGLTSNRDWLVATNTGSSDYPTTTGVVSRTFAGVYDVGVSVLSRGLSSLYMSTYIGGAATDALSDVSMDAVGAVRVLLSTLSTDVPCTADAYDSTANGSYDLHLTVLTSDLRTRVYGSYYGGSSFEYGISLLSPNRFSTAIVCQTDSANFPITAGSVPSGRNSGLLVVGATGPGLRYAACIGGADQDGSMSASTGPDGDLYLAGWTHSNDYPVTPGAYITSRPLSGAGFATRVDSKNFAIEASTFLERDPNVSAVDYRGTLVLAGRTGGPPTPGGEVGGSIPEGVQKISGDMKKLLFRTNLDVGGTTGIYGLSISSGSRVAVSGQGDYKKSPDAFAPVGQNYFGIVLTEPHPTGIAIVSTGATKTVGYWTSHEGTITNWRTVGTPIPSGWTFLGFADINGDERDDMVVQRTSDSSLGAYLLNNQTVLGWQSLGRAPAGWRIGAFGDVDGDGETDMIMERNSDKRKGAWLMKNAKIAGWLSMPTTPGTSLVGAADMDGNGWIDIVTFLGDDLVIRMRGDLEWTALGHIPPGYSVAGVGDFDTDGKADVLLWDPAAHALSVWRHDRNEVNWLVNVGATWAPLGTGRLY